MANGGEDGSGLIKKSEVFVKYIDMRASRGVVLRCILASCCSSKVRRNSVLVELRIRRLAVIQEETCSSAFYR